MGGSASTVESPPSAGGAKAIVLRYAVTWTALRCDAIVVGRYQRFAWTTPQYFAADEMHVALHFGGSTLSILDQC